MLYYIRYNVDHKNGTSDMQWKVFETEKVFHLTRNILIKTPTWSGQSLHTNGELKYSLYCEGEMTKNTEELIVIE